MLAKTERGARWCKMVQVNKWKKMKLHCFNNKPINCHKLPGSLVPPSFPGGTYRWSRTHANTVIIMLTAIGFLEPNDNIRNLWSQNELRKLSLQMFLREFMMFMLCSCYVHATFMLCKLNLQCHFSDSSSVWWPAACGGRPEEDRRFTQVMKKIHANLQKRILYAKE